MPACPERCGRRGKLTWRDLPHPPRTKGRHRLSSFQLPASSLQNMSIETFSPLPLNIFSTWVTLLDPSDVPIGMSPNLADVDFFPGGVRTRPGLVSQFPILAGAPQINALKTYITTNLAQRLLVLDSLGTLYKETSPGTL